jgi:hypothetical protein
MSRFVRRHSLPARTASVVIPALVVILIVGMLSVQTIQTLALVRRGDADRAKIMQAKELSEFARGIDWSTIESQSLTMQIPDAVRTVGEPDTQTAFLERQTVADHPETARIVVRFPADTPGEINTTWELKDE